MSVSLMPEPRQRYYKNDGTLAAGCYLYTYAAGTSTPKETYQNADGTTPHANPIVLDDKGEAVIYWTGNYKVDLKTAAGVQITGYPVDNYQSLSSATESAQSYLATVAGTPDVITAIATPPITAYAASQVFRFVSTGANTTNVTININGLGAKAITKSGAVALVAGDIPSGAMIEIAYDGTRFQHMGIVQSAALRASTGSALIGYRGTTVYDFLTALLGTDSATSGSVSGRQKLVNGGAAVAQRAVASLTTSAQLGAVDRCFIWASGGAVSAGTIAQATDSPAGRTGKAARASNITLTGSGVVSWRYRMEAKDAIELKNQIASFQIKVWHDVGSSINYTIIIRKPTAADDFTSTTVISTGSATSVATSTATTLSTPAGGVSLGDCSNGLEIEVQAACGAVTGKYLDFTEWQLEEGPSITPFERSSHQVELAACQRDYETGTATIFFLSAGAGEELRVSRAFKVTKRGIPTIVLSGGVHGNATSASSNATVDKFDFRCVAAASGNASADGVSFTASTGT